MKSARRREYIERKTKKKKGNSPVWKVLAIGLLIAITLLLVKMSTHAWDGVNKVAFTYPTGENIEVVVIDPRLTEVTTFIIPGETEVDVARNFGNLRIKNVWQLGENEKLGGSLLAETVTQNFLFPLTLWTAKDPGFYDGSLKSKLDFIFFPGRTNIKFGDRLRIVLFVAKVPELGRAEIDLKESRFLKCGKLNDGQPGCSLDGPISQRLTVYFSDNEIEGKVLRVNITDETGMMGVSERLGEIIQVIGGKVVSIERKPIEENMDCSVGGQNGGIVRKISELFSCKVDHGNSSFDLDIEVGKKFAERF